jgi:intracellular septation protein
MRGMFYDFVPVIIFFIAFKFYGIYVATVVGIAATALQVLIGLIINKKVDKQQLLTLVIFIIFGGMTLYFHNPLFIKWKPTIVFWIFSVAFLISQLFTKKPLIQHMLNNLLEGQAHTISKSIWKRLNLAWALFFFFLGSINLYVAYHYSTEAWVNFKLFGVLGILLAFSFLQAIWLSRYLQETKT